MQLFRRLNNFRLILKQIIQDGDYCLLFHLPSIDSNYYFQKRSEAEVKFGRSPHPLFDCRYYRKTYLPKDHKQHPFCHYLRKGFKAGYKPSPYFDYDVYADGTGWSKSQGSPLKHYLRDYSRRLPSPGIFFDISWYMDKTPILHDGHKDILQSYKSWGIKEKKCPIPVFSIDYYLDKVDNDPEATRDPLAHYITYSMPIDVQPCRWFDPGYYREKYLLKEMTYPPLEHYLRLGVRKGYYPNREIEELAPKPVISILVPVYNITPCFLNNCIRSVLYQSYPHWELCMADDGSTSNETIQVLKKWQGTDPRIKIIFNEENKGISEATNSASQLATGDFVSFLDNDDELAPECLFTVVRTILETDADMLYSDEDLIGEDGRRFSIFRKPDLNRILLLSHNYITHFTVVKRSLFEEAGRLRSACDGAQDFDLMLRLSALTQKIVHIPEILYHWRATDTSTSVNHSEKSYAHEAGKKALVDHIHSRKIPASIEDTERKFYYRTRYAPTTSPHVTVLIYHVLGSGSVDLSFLQKKSGYERCDFILITESQDDTEAISEKNGATLTVFKKEAHWSRAESLAKATEEARGEYLLLLDSTVIDIEDDWLGELVTTAVCRNADMVFSRPDFENEEPPFYSLPDLANDSALYYHDFLRMYSAHKNGLHLPQYVQFPGWNCCLIRKSDMFEDGGLDYTNFPHVFSLFDLTLRLRQSRDVKIIYSPYSNAIRKRVQDDSAELDEELKLEKKRFQEKWGERLMMRDPYYNYGILADNDIDEEDYFNWLCGSNK